MKILISTFGPDPENTLAAMRALPYEKLALVSAQGDMDTPGFKKIMGSEERSKGSVETVIVDEFDFKDCFRSIVDYARENARSKVKGKEVENVISINISGGSKIMGDAALLAAFHLGLPAHQCDKASVIRFPVIKGVSLKDRFTESQIAVLKEMGVRDTIDDISSKLGTTLTEDTIRKSLRKLRKLGVVRTIASDGKIVVELTEAGIFILETLNRFDRD
jgi:hypothetical protein